MATTYTTPGVFVEERSGPVTIYAAETAVPVFIGYSAAAGQPDAPLAGVPTPVQSLREYDRLFGNAAAPLFYQRPSIRLFFENGGRQCLVLSLGGFTAQRAEDYAPAFAALENRKDFSLLVLPDAVSLGADAFPVYRQALRFCSNHGCFAILDVPAIGNSPADHIAAFRAGIGQEHGAYGAAWYPMLHAAPDGSVVPPAGAVAGVFARQDNARGVWKAPANEELRGVLSPVTNLTTALQEHLNDGVSINALRPSPQGGVMIWGGRTLAPRASEWQYVSVRRTVSMIEKSLAEGLSFVVFEPNGPLTWIQAKAAAENFLFTLYRSGAFAGNKPQEAYFVRCGLGETMTAQDIAEGRCILEAGLALLRPAEFLVIRIALQAGAIA